MKNQRTKTIILIVAVIAVVIIIFTAVFHFRDTSNRDGGKNQSEVNGDTENNAISNGKEDNTLDEMQKDNAAESGESREENEMETRVDTSIVENMAPATEVDGITVTDEMLDKGILNEGSKARLMNVMERAAQGEEIVIAYIGGSITAGSLASPQATGCFAYLSTKWWEDTFPNAKITYVNAGIGATDSWLGAHRVQDDVLTSMPDLVVCEFAVNDGEGWNQETYDSLLRTLLEAPSEPAVIALMIAHKYGSFADKHAPAAFKYQVPIITYSALLTQGLVSWNQVGNSDGTHPDNPGHQLIARLLTEYYRRVLSEINQTEPEEYTVPELSNSLTACRYMNADILYSTDIEAVEMTGFQPGKVTGILASDEGWRTETGGTISFELEAREAGIIWLQKAKDPDGTYASYDFYVDGEFQGTLMGVADSWGNHLEYKSVILGDAVETHRLELRPTEGNAGTEFEILGVGISK